MSYQAIFFTVIGLWVASEIFILFVKRSKASEARRDDRNSGRVMALCLATGPILAGFLSPIGALRTPPAVQVYFFWIGLALVVIGFAIRLTAIFTLQRYFTVDVAIANDHKVIDRGLYGIVRHPSYAGSALSFFGLGLAFNNWASLVVLLIAAGIGIGYRIHVEEQALSEALGDDYRAYMARRKRLIPGVF